MRRTDHDWAHDAHYKYCGSIATVRSLEIEVADGGLTGEKTCVTPAPHGSCLRAPPVDAAEQE